MTEKLIIPCLDVLDGDVVKGVKFKDLRYIGDPVEKAKAYDQYGADELVFLDISATETGHSLMLDVIKKTVEAINIPLTVGGGINSLERIQAVLDSGASKVGINSAAISNPELVQAAAEKYGSKRICVAIDTLWEADKGDWFCYTHGGKKGSAIRVLDWAEKAEELGAGSLLVTSKETDGVQTGFDNELLAKIVDLVNIPVIASGGAGSAADFVEMFKKTDAAAGLAASIFHDKLVTVQEVKQALINEEVAVKND